MPRPFPRTGATMGATRRTATRWTGLALALFASVAATAATGCSNSYKKYSSKDVAQEWELGGAHVTIEVAKDRATRELGLMFRKSMPEDHGMLFVYPEPKPLRFWMKNTAIPLSIAFFDERPDGQV